MVTPLTGGEIIRAQPMVSLWLLLIFCSKKGFDVKSYGTGSVVKLPGASANEPIVYPFGTSYEEMYQDLYSRDPHLYPP